MHAGTSHAKTEVKKGDFDISVEGVTLREVVFGGVRAEELVDDISLNKGTCGYGCCQWCGLKKTRSGKVKRKYLVASRRDMGPMTRARCHRRTC